MDREKRTIRKDESMLVTVELPKVSFACLELPGLHVAILKAIQRPHKYSPKQQPSFPHSSLTLMSGHSRAELIRFSAWKGGPEEGGAWKKAQLQCQRRRYREEAVPKEGCRILSLKKTLTIGKAREDHIHIQGEWVSGSTDHIRIEEIFQGIEGTKTSIVTSIVSLFR